MQAQMIRMLQPHRIVVRTYNGKPVQPDVVDGVINFVFALPAFWTIDTFGRRSLLLATFPFMAVCHALISIAFGVTDSQQKSDIRIGLTIASMYLFGIAYSPGEGPVPFVWNSETIRTPSDRID